MLYTYKYKANVLIILLILSLSTIFPTFALAAPRANDGKDWQNINGNTWAQNYSPQTQIIKENVDQLEVKWLSPVPGAGSRPAGLQSVTLSEGITAPLIIHDGKVAGVTNFLATLQWDLKTGEVIWRNNYAIDVTEASNRLPVALPGFFGVHLHGINYWESGNMILNQGIVCDIIGVDFDSGETAFRIPDLCLNVPGNVYKYQAQIMAGGMASVGVWEKGRQFIYSLHGSLQGDFASGRNFIEGIDWDTHEVIWRIFLQPPQDRSDKDWALHNCDIGYFVTTPCSDVESYDRTLLEYDWQSVPGEPPHAANGVSGSWGQPVVDEDTGVFYIQSGNQSPYSNLTSRPGPNLYGSTILAIDMNVGRMKWWVEAYPHDPYDKDCNWSGMLIDHPQLGKVYVKGCKDGHMFVIDAETGTPLQRWNAVTETYGEDMQSYIVYDPAGIIPSKYTGWDGFKEMIFLPWAGAGEMELKNPEDRIDSSTVLLRPGVNDFAGDPAYDGEDTIFYKPVTGESRMITIDLEDAFSRGVASWVLTGTGNVDTTTTLVARDLVTGQVKWTWGPVQGDHRVMGSHIVITGGVAVVPNADGSMYFLDKDTGQLLRKMNMGAQMVTGPSVGQDSEGNSVITIVVGVGGGFFGAIGATIPGTVVTIGLSDKADEVKTTTITSTTTSRTTLTTTSVSTTTSVTTSETTSTITGVLQTSTTTVTSTEETGLPVEITYASVIVAVIAILAASILILRRK